MWLLVRRHGAQVVSEINSNLHSTLCVKAMIFLFLLDKAMDDRILYLKTLVTQADTEIFPAPFG